MEVGVRSLAHLQTREGGTELQLWKVAPGVSKRISERHRLQLEGLLVRERASSFRKRALLGRRASSHCPVQTSQWSMAPTAPDEGTVQWVAFIVNTFAGQCHHGAGAHRLGFLI